MEKYKSLTKVEKAMIAFCTYLAKNTYNGVCISVINEEYIEVLIVANSDDIDYEYRDFPMTDLPDEYDDMLIFIEKYIRSLP